ncbi:branched-chain-amino-acid aminotransferase-like protein 1 isoform X1 [Patiria miniata]|uniref:Sulfotransferase family protein n=2 Tax=Patiria miniata TaxID=46514 RepID=A0A913Z0Y8_PATMI|nr:branched-chain-amino-acid aminotransferase-like protein 1 isoform X1 [Patiria miniata]
MKTKPTSKKMATSEKAPSSENQVRLLIWTVPRSLSTVLSKCLSFVENTKVFFEMYESIFIAPGVKTEDEMANMSEEEQKFLLAVREKAHGISAGVDASQCTFQGVKEQLEEAHTGKKFIFSKDMAYAVMDRLESIPKGFRHLFLIRHPLKVFPSWKRSFLPLVPYMSLADDYRLDDLPQKYFPKGFGYKEVYELFEHVKKELDPEAIIIDADDLLKDPKGILSAVFNDIGLPFDEKILNWEAGDAVIEQWIIPRLYVQVDQLVGFYKNALDSTCFLKPKPLPDRSSISPDLLPFVDASMPYYQKMYSQRLSASKS